MRDGMPNLDLRSSFGSKKDRSPSTTITPWLAEDEKYEGSITYPNFVVLGLVRIVLGPVIHGCEGYRSFTGAVLTIDMFRPSL